MEKRKSCSRPGCPAVHGNRGAYCDDHRPAEQRNDTWRVLYSSQRWKVESRRFLKRNLWCACAACHESYAPYRATVVDHIKPHRGDERLFWDRKNWQALAKRCHDKKSYQERGGIV